jgi:hypothetical protein
MMTPQQRAAKTRAMNKANARLYYEVSKPAHEKVEKVLNKLLRSQKVMMKFVGKYPLKKGVTTGRLISIAFGGLSMTVLPAGYKHARTYAASFWEVI